MHWYGYGSGRWKGGCEKAQRTLEDEGTHTYHIHLYREQLHALRVLSYHAVKPIYIIRRKTELYSIVGVLHTFEYIRRSLGICIWIFFSALYSQCVLGLRKFVVKWLELSSDGHFRENAILCVSVLMCFDAERMCHEIPFRKNGDCLTGNKSWMNNKRQQKERERERKRVVQRYRDGVKMANDNNTLHKTYTRRRKHETEYEHSNKTYSKNVDLKQWKQWIERRAHEKKKATVISTSSPSWHTGCSLFSGANPKQELLPCCLVSHSHICYSKRKNTRRNVYWNENRACMCVLAVCRAVVILIQPHTVRYTEFRQSEKQIRFGIICVNFGAISVMGCLWYFMVLFRMIFSV